MCVFVYERIDGGEFRLHSSHFFQHKMDMCEIMYICASGYRTRDASFRGK